MNALDIARARVRSLVRHEGIAFVAGTGLLVAGGLLSAPALMFSGLVLLAISRRVLRILDRMRALVFGLELARDASEREESPVVVVAPLSDNPADADPRATPLAVRALAAAAIVTVLALLASFFPPGTSPAKAQRWTFVDDSFATSETWTIEHHAAATGGRALSKEAGSSALLVVSTSATRDVKAMTRCKGDEGCGLAFRISDDRNYVAARVSGGRVELVHVVSGVETVLASHALASTGTDVWQELAVEARGDVIRVKVNGASALDVHDPRPAVAGGVGLWAPARGWFDELSIETLATSPQAVEVLPFLRRPS
jgi:hypothetical protein